MNTLQTYGNNTLLALVASLKWQLVPAVAVLSLLDFWYDLTSTSTLHFLQSVEECRRV
jgi:hypothetical protein